MNNLLMIIQVLIILTTSLLCLSQECYNKEEIYTGTKLPYSCKDILANYPATPSGYYSIQPPGASTAVEVYCDMENERCGSKGWTRVANVDMSNVNESCPGDLRLISSPKQTCGGLITVGCASANFSTHGISYGQVCGRLRGYQVGTPDAFGPYVNEPKPDLVIDGVLISHGKAQKHIWAYATGHEKQVVNLSYRNIHCPCSDSSGVVPPFIGNDYYCDSGVDSRPQHRRFYTTPLWTGEGCTPPNFCCSHSGMPWFCKTLPVPTTDYIEIRNCHNSQASDEDTALDLIELYIR